MSRAALLLVLIFAAIDLTRSYVRAVLRHHGLGVNRLGEV